MVANLHVREGCLQDGLTNRSIVLLRLAGRVAARRRGARFGRKPKLSEHQRPEGRRRLLAGDSARAIARDFGVHHATVCRLR